MRSRNDVKYLNWTTSEDQRMNTLIFEDVKYMCPLSCHVWKFCVTSLGYCNKYL